MPLNMIETFLRDNTKLFYVISEQRDYIFKLSNDTKLLIDTILILISIQY
jgi:hypothetical protein